MVARLVNILNTHDFFLFGARGTGKSTLLKDQFIGQNSLYINLLDLDTFDRYLRDAGSLKAEILQRQELSWVLIDEVQKLPRLLDVVHDLIENTPTSRKRPLFGLTGSSARKLKRGSANLLAGRAFVYHLFPLTHRELGDKFDLENALNWGTLPKLLELDTAKEKQKFLSTYGQTYLKEEIWDEHIIRQLEPFRRFLEVAAQSNGKIVTYSKIARDVGVDDTTVREYFSILEDTLVGHVLEPFHESVRKRQRTSPKFYFFDTGVARALSGMLTVPLHPRTFEFGRVFEQFTITELLRLSSYLERDFKFSYFLTKDGAEIDLIVDRPGMKRVLVEIKSSEQIKEEDISTLQKLKRDFGKCEAICLSQDPISKRYGEIEALPWKDGISKIIGI